ncbi:MAG: UDP-N-acetylglucosamine 2-epimerase (non-hydrolyzing) [Anaerolineaceae bacterium]|nr:UDP-N-acetylglucosamine 2-epimerase (non-hydrolyzing) [Anaerolineaceae bacterium]
MDLIRVMTVFGTRPEAIKLAPVIQQLERDPRFKSIIVVTAQHREMLDQVLDLFKIKPDRDLNLMRNNQSLASLTASIFTHLDPILEEYKPDWLLVQGDTTTVMATTLAAYYRRIKIGHVEAGLRTGNKWQPFPEEINRRIASVTADLHFAPTDWARNNLLKENIADNLIQVTGNTIIDALTQITVLPIPKEIENLLGKKGILSEKKQLIVVTAHRRENFGTPIRNICAALQSLAEKYKNKIEIVYPVHLNPNINKPVRALLNNIPNITLLPSLEYLSLIHLLKHAHLIMTDSGGIQEEATGLGIPCLVLREVTERPEGIEAGVLKLVGTNAEAILKETVHLLDNQSAYQKMAHTANPYGDGKAAIKIVKRLLSG